MLTWFERNSWVHQDEQIWINGTRYKVVRVEHSQDGLDVACFVREVN